MARLSDKVAVSFTREVRPGLYHGKPVLLHMVTIQGNLILECADGRIVEADDLMNFRLVGSDATFKEHYFGPESDDGLRDKIGSGPSSARSAPLL